MTDDDESLQKTTDDRQWVLHFVSCTHWDREWYMTEGQFRNRLVRLLDRLIGLLERDPDSGPFLLDGQYLALKDYLDVRPQMRRRISALVKAGRIQIGPWYTQPICTLSSGESLIRNLLTGTRLSAKMGKTLNVGHMVDEFGHSACVPMLLNGFGINDMVAWRGMPKNSQAAFHWKGINGSEVTMFYTNNGYGNATAMPCEDGALAERVGLLIAGRREKAVCPHLLMLNGVDHAFAQENLLQIIAKINQLVPTVRAVASSIDGYIESVKRYLTEYGIPIRTVTGELQDPSESDVLPGSHSGRVRVKQANAKAETLLERWAEPFSAFARVCGAGNMAAQLQTAWEPVLQNHAHDSIVCSSVDEVEHQVLDRYERSMDVAGDIADQALKYIARRTGPCGAPALVVFNPLATERSEVLDAVIDLPSDQFRGFPCLVQGNRELPMAIRASRETRLAKYDPFRGHIAFIPVKRWEITFQTARVPSMGYAALEIRQRETNPTAAGSLLTSERTVENELIRLRVEADGTLSLTDKRTGRTFGKLHSFEDGGDHGHGYAYAKPESDVIVTAADDVSVTVTEDSPLKATLSVSLTMRIPAGKTPDGLRRADKRVDIPIRSEITVRAGSPVVEFNTAVINRACDHRLRVCFPSGITEACDSYAAQPFTIEKRPIRLPDLDPYPKEKPLATHPMQGWCAVKHEDQGLMVAAEGIYEYEVSDDFDRTVKLTLLRCVGRIDGDALGFVEDKLIPEAQCIGETDFRYCLAPFRGRLEEAQEQAFSFLHPMRAVKRDALEDEAMPWYPAPAETLPGTWSFIEARPLGTVVSAVKECEDRNSLIVRLYNVFGNRISIKVNLLGVTPAKLWPVRLDETRTGDALDDDGGWMELPEGMVHTLEIPISQGNQTME